MRTYTAHLAPHREPVLLREAFSWGAFLFGPLWLLARRAWIPAVLVLAALVAVAAVLPRWAGPPSGFALFLLAGVLGRDWVRWSLERRGYALSHVLAARDRDAAFARLLAARPDLGTALLDDAFGDRALGGRGL